MRNGRPWAIKIAPASCVCLRRSWSVTGLANRRSSANRAQTVTQEVRQTVTQEVRQTGDVKRLCLTVKTGERIDAMSCELIDPLSGGVK